MLQKIKQDIVQAMRDKSADRLGVLRMLKSAIENAQIAKKEDLTDPEIVNLIRKQIAQRQDSVSQFQTGGREELANKELEEITILREYLPVEWSDSELEENVNNVINKLGATTKKDMGRVIKETATLANGKCDNKRISQLVASKLS